MEVLRRTIAEQQSNPGQIIRTPQTPAFTTNSTFASQRADLERQYLDGKLTAKQYQKALDQLRQDERRRAAAGASARPVEAKPAAPGPATAAVAAPKPPPARPLDPPASAPGAATATATARPAGNPSAAPAPAAAPKTVSEVESKLEEMLRLKEARDRAALTNAASSTNASPAEAQTKRQRLDAILRQLVNGQITEADYNAKRAKIVAEP